MRRGRGQGQGVEWNGSDLGERERREKERGGGKFVKGVWNPRIIFQSLL